MKIYQLINGTFIDLEAISAVGALNRYGIDSSAHCGFYVWMKLHSHPMLVAMTATELGIGSMPQASGEPASHWVVFDPWAEKMMRVGETCRMNLVKAWENACKTAETDAGSTAATRADNAPM